MHWSEATPFFLSKGPTYNDKGRTKCFRPQNLLSLPSLSSKYVTDQFRTALAKRPKNWAWACLHCLPTRQTRMAMVLTLSLVHGVTLFSVHETTFSAVRIEPMKAVTSIRVNIKFTRPTYLYFESTPSLQGLSRPSRSCGSPDRLVSHNNQIAWSLSTRVKRVQGYY